MYDRFGYPGLFAAYNAGPGRYADHLSTGRPLPGETRAYLTALAGGEATQTSTGDPAPAAIFFVLKAQRSEEHTSELQSLMRISYAVFCMQKKIKLQLY